eukprot:1724838-Pleurochrysis_carterae.AAC.6
MKCVYLSFTFLSTTDCLHPKVATCFSYKLSSSHHNLYPSAKNEFGHAIPIIVNGEKAYHTPIASMESKSSRPVKLMQPKLAHLLLNPSLTAC